MSSLAEEPPEASLAFGNQAQTPLEPRRAPHDAHPQAPHRLLLSSFLPPATPEASVCFSHTCSSSTVPASTLPHQVGPSPLQVPFWCPCLTGNTCSCLVFMLPLG